MVCFSCDGSDTEDAFNYLSINGALRLENIEANPLPMEVSIESEVVMLRPSCKEEGSVALPHPQLES